MKRIDVIIGGRSYPVACGDGEEDRVQAIAAYVDEKLGELRQRVGQVPDQHMLVLTCLLLGDELLEARIAAAAPGATPATDGAQNGMDAVADALASLAGEIEALAARVAST